MEKQTCEFLDRCPMFKYFQDVARQIYADVYCQGSFEVCHRRRRRLCGEPVPDSLLPHGGNLWEDDQDPPPYWS
jgi:hypothetical protein